MLDESLWRAGAPSAHFSAPIPDEVDVAIVGGGITGITAAWLLARAGRSVAVFERERVGSGETMSTSAHLTCVTDLRLTHMVERFGRDAARAVWQGGAMAIDLIESAVSELGIECGFQRVPGYLCSPFLDGDVDAAALAQDAELASELGIPARYRQRGPITGQPAVEFADQALFHPGRYVHALARAVVNAGGVIVEEAEVGDVLSDPRGVIVNGHTVACTQVLIATHVPIMGADSLVDATLFQTKLYPYSTYVIGAHIDDSVEPGLYSDTSDPYLYLRVHGDAGQRYAILGGADHKTGQADDTDAHYAEVEEAMIRLLPSARLERRWSGQVITTSDGLPFIGEVAPGQIAATGYSGNGLTFGTLGAMMMRDAVLGEPNEWASILDPNRKATSAGSIAHYLRENFDYPLYYITDRLRRNRTDGPESIARGEGEVISVKGQPVACHRRDDGTLVKVSAYCTHMGCLVRWNGADRTWDCPCHGSRFTPEGQVMGGPAEAPLEPVEG